MRRMPVRPGSLQGTYPFGINANGAITGWYVDEANVSHGFVRNKHGELVEFDVPGAGTGPFQGPNVYSIAPNGSVTGFFFDPDNVVHGFVREADGARWACPNLTDSNSWPTDAAGNARVFLNHRQGQIEPGGRVKRPSGGSVQTAHEERIPVSIRLWCEAL